MTRPSPDSGDQAFWSEYLNNPNGMQSAGRRFFHWLPHGPRCRLCAAPFAGAGSGLMRVMGIRPSEANPYLCNRCAKILVKHHGGAEVDGAMLFADIRGSTSLAERMSPAEFRALLDRFYTVASDVVISHDGIVDKFVGDELVAAFPPMLSSGRHAYSAIEAAKALLMGTGHADPAGPWVSLGAGVHTGMAWFGAIGEGSHVELTVVGDVVNVTARLAAQAAPGEVLVSMDAARAAGLPLDLERRQLSLKGKSETVEAVTVRVAPESAASSTSNR